MHQLTRTARNITVSNLIHSFKSMIAILVSASVKERNGSELTREDSGTIATCNDRGEAVNSKMLEVFLCNVHCAGVSEYHLAP